MKAFMWDADDVERATDLFSLAILEQLSKTSATHVVILGATCKHCWHVNHMPPWKYSNGKKPFSQAVSKSHLATLPAYHSLNI